MKFEAATLLAWMIALNGLTVLVLISSGFVRVMRRRPAADVVGAEGLSRFDTETAEAQSGGEAEIEAEMPTSSDEPFDTGETRQRGEERLASSLRDWRGDEAGGEVLPLAAGLCRGSHRGTVTEHLV